MICSVDKLEKDILLINSYAEINSLDKLLGVL